MWVSLAIAAALFFAISNLIDKYVLQNWIKNPRIPVIFFGIMGLIASFLIYILKGFSALSVANTMLAILAGIFFIISVFLYFKAVNIEEVSKVIPLLYLTPLFTLIMAGFFLGEIFTVIKYIGVLLIVSGAILISLKKLSFGKAFGLMIFSSLMLAIEIVLVKYLLKYGDYWTVFAYVRIGAFLPLLPFIYTEFQNLKVPIKAFAMMSLSESLTLIGGLFFTIASSLGPVSLVNALSSVQPFFVFILAGLITLFYPKSLDEKLGGTAMKLVAMVLMFVGALLII